MRIFLCQQLELSDDYARSTQPLFKQEVQTYILLEPPSVFTRTDLTLALYILLDLLWEWLTLFPK